MATEEAQHADLALSESAVVAARRYAEALAAGLSAGDATRFAENDTDVGCLRRLVKDGCPAATIARIII